MILGAKNDSSVKKVDGGGTVIVLPMLPMNDDKDAKAPLATQEACAILP